MLWSMLAVALGFLGITVLGLLGVRVFVEVRCLGRQVAHATERIGRAAGELERASLHLARTGDGLPRRRPAAEGEDTPRTPPH
ncbi:MULTISPECIES: hypothetical protein [Streptomyces]|uniref:DUF948 domain-containing protein n=1 Tax=Streptomyces sudanensis TaxID=436397 RepID=A0ABY4THX9_9ACTN|nr:MULTISPECIES: hypothetical protein [Streptomyces]URN17938.1 hypothetical protein MW084_20620 [Streptomyces sudanensis]